MDLEGVWYGEFASEHIEAKKALVAA